MYAGIESIGTYLGVAALDVAQLCEARQLDIERFYNNLIVREKTVVMPFEDPISMGVNAAQKALAHLSEEERGRIELVVTTSESSVDFSKAMSTYIHRHLKLNERCRLFDMNSACYAGTAAFQMAVNMVLAQTSPGGKALVICSDLYRLFNEVREELPDAPYYEANMGAGAVALLVSHEPRIFRVDAGASGLHGFEVWDQGRPIVDYDYGDPDLSLMSYLDCCEGSFKDYQKRVAQVDYQESFDYLVFHTPFVGMVKGAHRGMMHKFKKSKGDEIERDYNRRVRPGTEYCQRVGNIMGGSVYMALAGLIDHGAFDRGKRVGVFSYGSGCSSEFYSGVVPPEAPAILAEQRIQEELDARYMVSMEEYEGLFEYNENLRFGRNNVVIKKDILPEVLTRNEGKGILVLDRIDEKFYRHYVWI